MQFPMWLDFGIVTLHPHFFFEGLGYVVGLGLMAREPDGP